MAYEPPKGLSKAVRGRSMVKRDYGADIRFKAYQRKAKTATKISGLGLVGDIAGGVAQVGKVAEKRLKEWEQLESGAQKVWEASPESKVAGASFEDVSPTKGESLWSKLTTDAPAGEVYKIGERGFLTEQLRQIGGMSGESTEMLRTEGKSLWESVGGKLTEDYTSGAGAGTGMLKSLFGEDYGAFRKQFSSMFQGDYLKLDPQSTVTTPIPGAQDWSEIKI